MRATPKGVAQLTYKLAHTRKRRPQDITDNIHLNDNKCNTLAENGDIKKVWSEYYSEMLNETKRKGNCCMLEKLKEKYLRYPYLGDQKASGYKMKSNKTLDVIRPDSY